VDDFEDNRAMYAEYLKHAGYRVIEAENGRVAVDRARESLPDVVVMDLSLPVMDGWEATRELKGDGRTSRIPVIALTGHALAGHSQSAREAGCDEFLTKPCLPKTLLEKLRSILDSSAPAVDRQPKSKEVTPWRANGERPLRAGRAKAKPSKRE
jgi:two-component system cell cycle response regulator DivK